MECRVNGYIYHLAEDKDLKTVSWWFQFGTGKSFTELKPIFLRNLKLEIEGLEQSFLSLSSLGFIDSRVLFLLNETEFLLARKRHLYACLEPLEENNNNSTAFISAE